MTIIGLTGVSGSGKGYISQIFSTFGVPSIDSDAVVHKLYSSGGPCVDELKSAFGEDITDVNGSIDRKKLGNIVFNDSLQLEKLNGIVHKYVIAEINETIESYAGMGYNAVIIDAPQLFEAGVDRNCDHIVSVIADKDIRTKRIVERDGISEESAALRINSQHDDCFFISRSDFVIYNSGEDLVPQVKYILEKTGLI